MSWCKPPAGVLKANFDAYLSPNGEVGSLGAVFRDSLGQVAAMGVKRVEAKWDATTAEAMAALYVVDLGQCFGYERVMCEGDALLVVNAVNNKCVGGAPLFHIFGDINRLCLNFVSFSFSHVKRGGNVVAHLLARWDCSRQSEVVWFGSFPQSISTLVALDLI